jgi:hypothetical protein
MEDIYKELYKSKQNKNLNSSIRIIKNKLINKSSDLLDIIAKEINKKTHSKKWKIIKHLAKTDCNRSHKMGMKDIIK